MLAEGSNVLLITILIHLLFTGGIDKLTNPLASQTSVLPGSLLLDRMVSLPLNGDGGMKLKDFSTTLEGIREIISRLSLDTFACAINIKL